MIPDAGQLAAITRCLQVSDPGDIALRDRLAEGDRKRCHARRLQAAAA